MKIAIIGTGYVGLVTGACFAHLGNDVICLDIDKKRIADLKSGIMPIVEKGLEEMVAQQVRGGRLAFTSDLCEAAADAEMIFICVGTPEQEDGSADLRFVISAIRALASEIKDDAIVVLKSTVPVGTADIVEEEIKKITQKKVFIASNPEFLKEGKAVDDFLHPDRLVVGLEDMTIKARFSLLYDQFNAPILFVARRSAEMIKYASNAFLATKISFINEIANICENVGADIDDVARGMGLDARIGPAFLQAGIGYGGSCFPKDVLALAKIADSSGHDFQLLKSVMAVNESQKSRFVHRIKSVIGDLQDKHICVLGLAFKNGTDDIRKSVAIDLIIELKKYGAKIIAYDPMAMEKARLTLPDITYATSATEAMRATDAVVVATDWNEFLEIDWSIIGQFVVNKLLFDGRNILDKDKLKKDGWEYYGIGR